jgi:hypothetical protein
MRLFCRKDDNGISTAGQMFFDQPALPADDKLVCCNTEKAAMLRLITASN